MGLFESSKNRAKRMLNGLKKAQLRLQRSINTIGTQVSKAEAQAVEAAKSGQRLQVRAAAERVHTMMRMKMEYQRRDNMLSMWILKAEHAQGDSEIAAFKRAGGQLEGSGVGSERRDRQVWRDHRSPR